MSSIHDLIDYTTVREIMESFVVHCNNPSGLPAGKESGIPCRESVLRSMNAFLGSSRGIRRSDAVLVYPDPDLPQIGFRLIIQTHILNILWSCKIQQSDL